MSQFYHFGVYVAINDRFSQRVVTKDFWNVLVLLPSPESPAGDRSFSSFAVSCPTTCGIQNALSLCKQDGRDDKKPIDNQVVMRVIAVAPQSSQILYLMNRCQMLLQHRRPCLAVSDRLRARASMTKNDSNTVSSVVISILYRVFEWQSATRLCRLYVRPVFSFLASSAVV